jgi:hypothetical protein
MNMPGFTAEASLYKTSGRWWRLQTHVVTAMESKELFLSFPLIHFASHTAASSLAALEAGFVGLVVRPLGPLVWTLAKAP